MKTHRRIEITAFRRRVTITTGETAADPLESTQVRINHADSENVIETGSDEGRRILTDAICLLKEKLSDQS